MSREQDLFHLGEMIKDMKFTMMTTIDGDGCMHSRPMATLKFNPKDFDGKLWFFSKENSHKVHAIENDQHVNLAYSNPEKHHYISVSGSAEVVKDKSLMEKLWNPSLKAWFPEGINDPDISLINVKVDTAELWDSPPSKVKSMLTGQSYGQKTKSQHIDLSNQPQ